MDNFKHPYTQSIRFTAGGFCLCYSNDRKELVSHTTPINYRKCSQTELTDKLTAALESSVFNNKIETSVIFDTNYFSAIPVGIFEENDYPQLLEFIYTDYKTENHKILSSNLSDKCILIYSVNQIQYNSIMMAGVKPAFTNQFEELAQHSKNHIGNTIICNLAEGIANIMCFENKSVLLVNRYECSTPEDVLYYLLQTAKTTFDNKTNDITYIISGYSANDRKLLGSKLTQTVFI